MTARRLRHGILALTAAAALAACGHDGGGTAVPQNVCASIETLDPSGVLGGPAAGHRACAPDPAGGSLGVAVWTAADGRRVSVSVVDNAKAGPGVSSATFDQLYQAAPGSARCTATAAGRPGVRCVDKTDTGQTETGTVLIDEDATYLVVWVSNETGGSAGFDIPPSQRPAFAAFVAQATKAVYGTAVELPAAAPAPATAPPTAAGGTEPSAAAASTDGGAGVSAELTAQGYRLAARTKFHSDKLGREVIDEDWQAPQMPNLPVVHLTDAPPGDAGRLAVESVSYEGGVGPYRTFSCTPTPVFAFDARHVIEQAGIARGLVLQATAQPGAATATSMTARDGSVTCRMQ